ncbi:hypothetical protein CO610_03095 [Lysobacteraceae bacterium NML95-0200]|nr:hypothetical protein CO610_03095 [Xanthomonadaceae bacterium NML95-0200]
MKYRSLALALLALLPLTGMAQQRGAVAPQAQAQVQQDIDPNSILTGALHVADLIDNGRAAEVWEGASIAAKSTVSRDAFVNQLQMARAPLGQAQSRVWLSVLRQQINPAQGESSPLPGTYVTVRFATRFSSGKTLVELISFRMDDNTTWRVAGYSIQ